MQSFGIESRIEIIHTTGDKITDVALSKVGTKGLFTKEIEEALLEGPSIWRCIVLKDMPTELPEGLTLAAIPEREDPRDALVGGSLAASAGGASGHQLIAAVGAASGAAAGSGNREHTGQCGHALAEAG